MFVETSRTKGANGKVYTRTLMRTSERVDGKVVHRTVANLSHCSEQEILAVKAALKHKDKLTEALADLEARGTPAHSPSQQTAPASEPPAFTQGPSIGAISTLMQVAQQIGITEALGHDRQGRLALWQVIARALDQGSRLSAVRLARDLRADSLIDLGHLDEDDLYANLAWLEDNQERIEQALFEHQHPGHKPSLYLYDVTSTYLEGEHNAFAAFGYNRDGKKGKRQLVVGLLCDEHGSPVAIEAFPGNTSDPRTVASQVDKLRERFHAQGITLVGDRGMIRGPQIELLRQAGMHHITAITKPQIEALLERGALHMDLFDNPLGEVIDMPEPACAPADETSLSLPIGATRYILRRNPQRQAEMAATRASKQASLMRAVAEQNDYLAKHGKATVSAARKRLERRTKSLGVSGWLSVEERERVFSLRIDVEAQAEESKLDGCYVIRTDLRPEHIDKESVHSRYKDLAQVEEAFRRSKTVELEIRPVHVRSARSTRGHLLVVMLAYQLMKELGKRWANEDMTVREGLERLNTYCAVEVAGVAQVLLAPRADVAKLLASAGVSLPKSLRQPRPRGSQRRSVDTKAKLPKRRPRRRK